RDITKKLQAEERLIASEARFRSIIEQFPYPVINYAPDGSCIGVNKSWETMWQDKRDNVKGYNILEDKQMMGSVLAQYVEKAFKGETSVSEPYFYDPVLIGQKGRKRWMVMTLFPLKDQSGELLEVILILQDITESKKTEQQLSREKQLLRTLIDNLPDYIYVKDMELRHIINNAANVKLIGAKTEEETLGKTSIDYFGAELGNKYNNDDAAILNNDTHLQNKEESIITSEGEQRWLLTTKLSLKDNNNNVIGLVGISRDITERKKAEEKILNLNTEVSKSEKKFRGLIENSYDIVSLLDENFNTFYRSPSSERITGWSDDERKQKGGGIDETHPDDIEKLIRIQNELVLNHAKPFPVSFRTKHKSGHYIWIEGIMTNMLHDESLKGIVCNLRDVTEKKEAEEKIAKSEKIYKTIASGIPGSVICLIDADFRYFLIEGDMLEKLGYSKEILLGNKIKDVVPPERYEEFLPNLERVFCGELFTVESSSLEYDFLTRYVPLKDENNLVYAAMTVAIDISELKKAERQIAELNVNLEQKVTKRTMQLQAANKELEAFTYSVSHDLRSPLRAVSGYSTMMKEDYGAKLDAEGNRILDAIVANSKRMGQLIDDLLNFSRLGRKEVSYHSINMTEMAESCKADLLSNADTDTGKYDLHISTLPDADGDHSMIRQVWMNLLSNAIKYSHKKNNPVIEIGYINDAVMNTYFVRDNGAGFDMHYVHKLFGVFQRLHSNEEFEGTGVGLALTERIIHKHKGKIWAEASIDNGATFYFSLPKMT
ncbi:MAG: PAS domain S-box protein, partial [Panacibacter sp.]